MLKRHNSSPSFQSLASTASPPTLLTKAYKIGRLQRLAAFTFNSFHPGAQANPFASVLPLHTVRLELSLSSTFKLPCGSPVCKEVTHTNVFSWEVLRVTPRSVILSVAPTQQKPSARYALGTRTCEKIMLSWALG